MLLYGKACIGISVTKSTPDTIGYVNDDKSVDVVSAWSPPFEDFDEQKPTRKSKKKMFTAAALVLVFVFTTFYANIGVYFNSKISDTTQLDEPTRQDVLQGIKDADLYVLDTANIVTHVHAHLAIMVQGKSVTIPVIGVDMDTLTAAPIHTHDTSGTLHIETDSTNSYAPNALDFIRLWNKGEDNLCLIFAIDAKCKVTISINNRSGALTDAFKDGDRMVVRISLPDKPVYV